MAEDRELFRNAMSEIGLECPKSQIARSLEEAHAIAAENGYPWSSGPRSPWAARCGIAYNREELEAIVARGLEASPTSRC